ncbi:unnamed protein product [Linum tenue]|uniref:Uncharacterized protein n=1 Tax=Linum tenue TaxID=586396 RepID=A0AAV0PZY6_9ROSI|nr:unnamed protein product [Linum tenue]
MMTATLYTLHNVDCIEERPVRRGEGQVEALEFILERETNSDYKISHMLRCENALQCVWKSLTWEMGGRSIGQLDR